MLLLPCSPCLYPETRLYQTSSINRCTMLWPNLAPGRSFPSLSLTFNYLRCLLRSTSTTPSSRPLSSDTTSPSLLLPPTPFLQLVGRLHPLYEVPTP